MSKSQQTILVVDDDKSNRIMLTEILKDSYKIILAKNGSQALELIAEHRPDLVLMDVVMPDMDGYEVISILKQKSSDFKNISVIFITSLHSIDSEEKGLLLGAADYITKPFHAPIVRARVHNHMQLIRQRYLLENLANIDTLTEIPNRRQYEYRSKQEWNRCLRNGDPLSFAIIDIDCFKQYNDHFGHMEGDIVLHDIAQQLQQQLHRPDDMVARYGGEEFVVILPRMQHQEAEEFMLTVTQHIANLQILHAPNCNLSYVTISVGGATITPQMDRSEYTLEHLVNSADQMLYKAKQAGRNCLFWHNFP